MYKNYVHLLEMIFEIIRFSKFIASSTNLPIFTTKYIDDAYVKGV